MEFFRKKSLATTPKDENISLPAPTPAATAPQMESLQAKIEEKKKDSKVVEKVSTGTSTKISIPEKEKKETITINPEVNESLKPNEQLFCGNRFKITTIVLFIIMILCVALLAIILFKIYALKQ